MRQKKRILVFTLRDLRLKTPRILSAVKRQGSVLITNHGVPVARMNRVSPREVSRLFRQLLRKR